MLFILNKGKICAYLVSVLTVVILFCVTLTIQDTPETTVPTSSNTSISNSSNTTNQTD